MNPQSSKSLFFCILFLTVVMSFTASSQVSVFQDDFSNLTSTSWTTSGSINGSVWNVNVSGVDFGARRNTAPQQLELSNDSSPAANQNGWCLTTVDASGFASPYSTILADGGVVSWTFNMQQIRANPSGFGAGEYGVAFILAGESSTTNSSGAGYAVVLGEIGATDAVRLIRYSNGIAPSSNHTTLIASNTTGLNDIADEHLSVQVVFNPCANNEWSLYLRNDGATFSDPLSGTLILQGTFSDNTHTGQSLDMLAAYWHGATLANQTAFFDNVTVSVTPLPDYTVSDLPSSCVGDIEASIDYVAVNNTADLYSIDWDVAAEMSGLIDVSGVPITPGSIFISDLNTIPAGIYAANLYMLDSATGCEEVIAITLTINSLPDVICPDYEPVCSSEAPFVLSGELPGGGIYSGTGVSGNLFDPSQAEIGDNIITYTYDDGQCINSCTFIISVSEASEVEAGTYQTQCVQSPDLQLEGTPAGGVWSGVGVTGNLFDPSVGTQTLTYTVTNGGCAVSDDVVIQVDVCPEPNMRWVILDEGVISEGCVSNSDCDENIVCVGLEYTTNKHAYISSYSTAFFSGCLGGNSPIILEHSSSCIMNDNTDVMAQFCGSNNIMLFNASGNGGTNADIVMPGVPKILHQMCFQISSDTVLTPIVDVILGLTIVLTTIPGNEVLVDVPTYIPFSFDSAVICGILPVTWLSFDVKSVGVDKAMLSWSTTEEFNTDRYEIQRSFDGKNFHSIGKVYSNDQFDQVNEYSFPDNGPLWGKVYYRLKQWDRDGKYGYSAIESVQFAQGAHSIKIYPNPVKDILQLHLNSMSLDGDFEITDMAGRILKRQAYSKGSSIATVPIEHLPPGTYILRTMQGSDVLIEKFLVIK